MDVTALFDDADTAGHALVNLQALGIFPSRYKIKALHIPSNVTLHPMSATAGTGDRYFSAGGYYGISAGDSREGPNLEVQLLLTVEDSAAHRAKSALISNHGRQVRVL
jgi:hypothetical protein